MCEEVTLYDHRGEQRRDGVEEILILRPISGLQIDRGDPGKLIPDYLLAE